MRRTFDDQPDGGENLEVAMAVQIFHRLQDAGLIDPNKRLSSGVPRVEGFRSTSYEARLVELIRDADDNGRLDIDLAALARAGITNEAVSPSTLELHLGDHSMEAPSYAFFMRSSRSSDLADYGLTAKGRTVRDLTEGLHLESSTQRATDQFLRTVPQLVARGEAQVVAEQAMAAASIYTKTDKPEVARTLLSTTAHALVDGGARKEAAVLLRALTKAPHASVPQHIGKHFLDRMEGLRFDPDRHAAVFGDGGNSTTVDVNKFRSTVGRVAAIRVAQLELVGRMEKTLHRAVDPFKTADVRSYFQQIAKTGSSEAIAAEFEAYLKAFYVHAGEGVTWSKSVPIDERPNRIDELIEKQPADGAGRRLIDCECFAYLADNVFSSIETKGGDHRFAVRYVQRPGHITALVVDRASRRAFGVDNEDVDALGTVETDRALVVAAGNLIAGRGSEIFRISRTPSDAKTTDEVGLPKRGSVGWKDGKLAGIVDDRVRDHYAEVMRGAGRWVPFSAYLDQLIAR